MSTYSTDRLIADFARISPALPGAHAPRLAGIRRAALERFLQSGFPTTRDEEWKYTSVAALERRPFSAMPDGMPELSASQLDALGLPHLAGHRLVFVDGRYAPRLSAMAPLPAGATLQSMDETLRSDPDVLQPLLTEASHRSIFGALNTAFMAGGVYIDVPQGIELDEPIHLLFVATRSDAAIHPCNVIVAGEGARLAVIEHYAGSDGIAYFTNAMTHIVAARAAVVDHYKLQQEGAQAFHIAGVHATQSQSSRFTSHSLAFGAALARNDITTTFGGEGCEAMLNGLYLARGKQHVDHHTRIDHAHPRGTSREHYRGLLDGASRGVFNGKVIVHPQAQRSDAHQVNHNLLLSRHAEVDTKPQLEIYADDVKCTHGATVGQLDDAQLFYLRSRGLDAVTAKNLLTYAFARDVIERIRIAALRTTVEKLLLARLPQDERIGELA